MKAETILEIANAQGVAVFTKEQAYAMYDELINERDGLITLAGCTYDAAEALKMIDETNYRCGFNDWLNGEELDEVRDANIQLYMRRADIETIKKEGDKK